MLRFDGYYLSDVQVHLRNDGGRRVEEEYYLFYKFFPDGTWICKTTGTDSFDLEGFLLSVDLISIRQNPHEDEPLLPDRELLFQSGTYVLKENWLEIEWKNSNVQEEALGWRFRMREDGNLETYLGDYSLRFIES